MCLDALLPRGYVTVTVVCGVGENNSLRHMHGKCMATAWQPHGNCMATAWQLHGNRMAAAWQLHGNCMATAWQLHGNCIACMATAWQLHGNTARARHDLASRILGAAMDAMARVSPSVEGTRILRTAQGASAAWSSRAIPGAMGLNAASS